MPKEAILQRIDDVVEGLVDMKEDIDFAEKHTKEAWNLGMAIGFLKEYREKI